jgi:hypothetical protein
MTFALLAWPLFRATDSNGAPLAAGKLYSYAAGTSSPLALYASDGLTPLSNPVVLNSAGQAEVRLGASAYKLDLTDASGVRQAGWPIDQIQAPSTLTLTAATFTPVVRGLTTAGTCTYSVQQGTSILLGSSLRFFSLTVQWTGHTGTGQVAISGLPAAAATALNNLDWGTSWLYTGTGLPLSGAMKGLILPGEAQVRGYYMNNADDSLQALEVKPAGAIVATGFYGV